MFDGRIAKDSHEHLHLDISDALLQDEVAKGSHYADILPTIRLELPKDSVRLGYVHPCNGNCYPELIRLPEVLGRSNGR